MSTIRRNKRKQNFTIIPNSIIESGLTLEAQGVLIYLLSKPDDWKMQIKDLHKNLRVHKAGRAKPLGRDALRSILAELESAKYLKRVQLFVNGRYVWESIVNDEPME